LLLGHFVFLGYLYRIGDFILKNAETRS